MRVIRKLIIMASASVTLLLTAPLGLYCVGLSNIEGRPQKPAHLASVEQQSLVWKRAHGDGTSVVQADNPYSYLASICSAQRTPPSKLVTWWVARDYLSPNKRYEGMGWWHLSGAALAIWLSRNWTSEEILSAAAQLRHSASGRMQPVSATGEDDILAAAVTASPGL